MDPGELVLALERVELFSTQGKCRKQHHPSASIQQLRTKGPPKQSIHIWQDCRICGGGQSRRRMPETAEQAILLLENSGRINRPNIRRLILGPDK